MANFGRSKVKGPLAEEGSRRKQQREKEIAISQFLAVIWLGFRL
jgi:hypothetical protein